MPDSPIDALGGNPEKGAIPKFRLRTLGGVEVLRDGSEEPVPLHRRQLALLALLAAFPRGTLSRDRILALLWEESDETRARDSLKQAVHAIRGALHDDALITELNELHLDFGCVRADVAQLFNAAIAERHEDVVTLYRGPFLDGFNLPKAAEFAHWVDAERARIAQLWRASLERLATTDQQAGQYALAAKRWQTLAAADPLDASLARAVVRAFASDHNVPAAVRHARLYEARLREELGLEPDAAFRELVAAVSSGSLTNAIGSPARSTATPANRRAGDNATASGESFPALPADDPNAKTAERSDEKKPTPTSHTRRARRSRPLLYGAVAGLLIAGTAFAVRSRGVASRLDPRQFYVTALSVAPEDSSLSTLGLLAREQLELGISQFGSMRVVDLGEVRPSHGSDQQSVDVQVAHAAAAGTIVRGAIRRLGDTLIFSAAIVDGRNGTVRGQVEPVAVANGKQVEGIEALRDRLVALMAVQFDDDTYSRLDASSSLPRSLEAYQLYRQAEPVYYRGSFPEAFALAMRAYRLDTLFVRTLIFAAHVRNEMGDCAFRESIAVHLRAPAVVLKPLDRIVWERDNARCSGDYLAALALAEESVRLRPASAWALGGLAHSALDANQPRRTLEVMKLAAPLLNSPPFVLLAGGPFLSALHVLGRHTEELAFSKHFESLQPNDNEGYSYELCALAALGRGAEIQPILAHIAQLPSGGTATAGGIARLAAGELRVHGDAARAGDVLDWALSWFRARPLDEQRTELYQYQLAGTLADAGYILSADSIVRRLSGEHAENLDYRGQHGVLAARLNDTTAARAVDRWLANQPPQQGRRSLWRARIAARLGDTPGALTLLQAAVAEGIQPTSIFFRLRIHTIDDFALLRATKEFALLLKPAK
jgi:DNA-binding SARP family transcriptional activator